MTFKVVVKKSMENDGKARWVSITYGDKLYHGLLDSWDEVNAKIQECRVNWEVD